MSMLRITGFLASVLAATSIAGASIVSTTNVNVISPPPSVEFNQLEGPQAYLFAEKQNYTTTAPITVDVTSSGTYETSLDITSTEYASGQAVDSYYLHFDKASGGANTTSGSIVFEEPILALIGLSPNLIASHSPLGAVGTTYWTVGLHGTWDTLDSVTLDQATNTVSFDFHVGTALDSMRILTAAHDVPEPGSMHVLGIGLAVLGFGRRMRG
jgi:hypothetical protein